MPTYKSILVTGGTGTFGQAFARYALDQGLTGRFCIYSRDEYKQAVMRQTLSDDRRCRWMLGDVRDRWRLKRAMQGNDVVIHAAALKRIEAGEYNPGEFVKTNIDGAMNVIEAATDAGVTQVVALSTDKACSPSTLYGATKLAAERLILAANNARGATGPRFSATRYGNVAGSRGSVIPAWRACIAAHQPLPLTDPEVTRFWMTATEAVSLVVWTMQHMQGGELVVPSLPAYRLGDLAEALAPGWETRISGLLSNGEKRHESMIGPDEISSFRPVGSYWVQDGGDGLRLQAPLVSDTAERLSIEALRERLVGLEGV